VVTAPAYEHLELKAPPEPKSKFAEDEPDLFEAGEA
jgi:hypothetical protein